MLRVAVVQCDPHLTDIPYNLSLIEQQLALAAESGVQLAAFPECAVTGYV
jgi:predicted amidohydrolase